MQDYHSFFKRKKITLMRIGLLGRGVGDAAFLAECGAEVLVVDDAPQAVMQPSVDALKKYPNVSFKFGPYDLDDFRHCDLVLKGAGTPLHSPEIAEAKRRGIPVRMSADLFAELSGATIVGVTGTRGKSTVAHLVAHTLRHADKKVLLGGNVRGISTLALLPQATPETIAVLELDSWQLQGFGEARLSPQIAVFTTFYPDHLNYYGGDLEAYLADKAEIFLHQHADGVLIVGEQAEKIVQEHYEGRIPSQALVAYAGDVPREWRLALPGEHNRENAACALFALRVLRIPEAAIRAGFETFRGVPGRLELAREVRGVAIYNDTTATTPEATRAALAALDPSGAKNIVLLAGGSDKGLAMTELVRDIRRHCKSVFFLAGNGTDRIRGEFPGAPVFEELPPALEAAFAAAEAGDILLFSPAFTSFGIFKNEYDRGEQFARAAAALL